MANPKLTLEVGTVGLASAIKGLKEATVAAEKLATAEKGIAGDRTRANFRKQQNVVEQFRRSLDLLRGSAKAFAAGGAVGTATNQFRALERRVASGALSNQQFATAASRLSATMGTAAVNVNKARGAIERQSNTAKKGRKDNEGLATTMKNLSSTAVLAVGPLSGIGARLVALGAIAQRTNIALSIFFGTVAAGITGFVTLVRASSKAQDELAKIRGVLIATGKAATITAESVRAVTERLVDITPGGAVGDINDAAVALLAFRNVGEESLERLLTLSADLAAAGFGTLLDNAKKLGGILEAPSNGLRRLRTEAPLLRNQLRRVVKEMDRFGDGAGIVDKVLTTLEGKFSGTASAINVGLTASLGALQAELRRLAEDLGGTTGALTLATSFVDGMTSAVQSLRSNIEAVSVAFVALGSAMSAVGLIGFAKLLGITVAATSALAIVLGATAAAAIIAIGVQRRYTRINERVSRSTVNLKNDIEDLTKAVKNNVVGSREAAKERLAQLEELIAIEETRIRRNKAAINQAREAAGKIVNLLRPLQDLAANLPGLDKFFNVSEIGAAEEMLKSAEQRMKMIAGFARDLRVVLGGDVGKVDEFAEAIDDARKRVASLLRSFSNLQTVFGASTTLNKETLAFANAFVKVEKILTDTKTNIVLNAEAIQKLAANFPELSGSADDIVLQLQKIVKGSEELEDATGLLEDYAERIQFVGVPDRLADITKELETLKRATDNLANGPAIFAELRQEALRLNLREVMVENRTHMQEFAVAINEIEQLRGFAEQAFQGAELAQVLAALQVQQGRVTRQMIEADPVLSTLTGAFQQLGDSIVDSFLSAENSMEALKASIKSIVDDIIKQIVRLTIINGILNAIFGADTFPTVANGSLGNTTKSQSGPPRGQFGGSFRVTGVGGTDSVVAPLRVTPGELVTVERSQDVRNRRSGGGGRGDTYFLDARGSDPGQIRRLEEQIFRLNGSIEKRAVSAVREANVRSRKYLGRRI